MDTWAEAFGCDSVTVSQAIDVIVTNALLGTSPLVLAGHTGQGKSDAVYAAYRILKKKAAQGLVPMELAKLPSNPAIAGPYADARRRRAEAAYTCASFAYNFVQWTPSAKDAYDFSGLTYIDETPNGRIQKYAKPDDVPCDFVGGQGILNVRELNRPATPRTIKPLIEMMESRMVGTHVIPEGYRFVVDINVGDLYDVVDVVNPFFIRRAQWVFVENTLKEFTEYMTNMYETSIVVEFLADNPELFDNHVGRSENTLYACAPVWESVHHMLERAKSLNMKVTELRHLLAGSVTRDVATSFLAYLEKGLVLSPARILENYSAVKSTVLNLIDRGSGGDVVGHAAKTAVRILLSTAVDDPILNKQIFNFAEFFEDLPLEVAQMAVVELGANPQLEVGAKLRQALVLHSSACREKLTRLFQVISSAS